MKAFSRRFLDHLAALGLPASDAHLLVAVSGGCDSVVLLHLLRFAVPAAAGQRLTVAHFDHAMRGGSEADAGWVAGLCRAWQLPLVTGRAEEVLHSEADARRARYRFLRQAARERGATHLATAHHADDQAETVFFRVLRGTGLPGLGGISPGAGTGLIRPLLPFWRAEIEHYARSVGLRWRTDPTNRSLHPVRNRIRHELLPQIERTIAPAARRNLVRLARLAREAEAGWASIVEPLAAELARAEAGALVLARKPLRTYHPALGTRVLRHLLRRFGPPPGEAGTRMALQFITDAPSGRQLSLPGGVRIRVEYEVARIERAAATPVDRSLRIGRLEPGAAGSGTLRLGGRDYRAEWSVGRCPREPRPAESSGAWRAAFDRDTLRLPLELRAWRPGDRIRLRGGSRRLKRLFGDHKIPRSARAQRPVLVDADGTVLWVAGVVQAPHSLPQPGRDALFIQVVHA